MKVFTENFTLIQTHELKKGSVVYKMQVIQSSYF